MSQLSVEGNYLYFTKNTYFGRLSFNDIQLSITPTWENNGTHIFTITANDGRGGKEDLNITIVVLTRNPIVVLPIPDQIAIIDEFYQLQVDKTFSSPDGAPLSLSVTHLPAWLSFNSTSSLLSGTPTVQYFGQTEIQVIASDPFDQKAIDAFILSVERHSPGISIPGIIGGSLLGVCSLVGGTVGLYYFIRKKQAQARYQFDHFELSPKTKSNICEVFGEGKYGWLDLTTEERQNIFEATGLITQNEKGLIGRGHYGALRVCWSFEKNQYSVAKVVRGKDNFEDSLEEAALQRKATGPNVCPIYNTIKDIDQDQLIHLMPIAGLNNLEHVRRLIIQGGSDVLSYGLFIAKDVLTGLQHLHAEGIYHCDLKPSNIITSRQGESLITDFGLSIQSNSPSVHPRISDYRYQSPERATAKSRFRADYDDSWAVGCLLLEFIKGWPMKDLFLILHSREAFKTSCSSIEEHKHAIQGFLDQISELQAPNEDSIWWLIKNLLQVDTSKRWLPTQALKAKCFATLDASKRKEQFDKLVEQQRPQLAMLLAAKPTNPQERSDSQLTSIIVEQEREPLEQELDLFYDTKLEDRFYVK